MTSNDSGERYSLEALLALYEYEPEIKDVYVEGRTDAGFLEWYFTERGISAKVFAIDDRVELHGDLLRELSLDIGARGRVIALAMVAERALGSAQRGLTCVADADFARVTGPSPLWSTCLLLTDTASFEGYVMQPRPMDKLLRSGLHVSHAISTDDVIGAIAPALLDLLCIRAALYSFDIPCIDAVEKNCTLKVGSSLADVDQILGRSIGGVKKRERPINPDDLAAWVADLRQAPDIDAEVGRGHDIAPLLVAFLKLKGPIANRDALEIAMRVSLEVSDVQAQPMFVALEERLAA